MPRKKSSGLPKWVDPDEAPKLTKTFFERGEIRDGDKVIRRGRPPIGSEPKASITLRLDTDILEAYRGTGDGWQSRINADLRRARKLGKVG